MTEQKQETEKEERLKAKLLFLKLLDMAYGEEEEDLKPKKKIKKNNNSRKDSESAS